MLFFFIYCFHFSAPSIWILFNSETFIVFFGFFSSLVDLWNFSYSNTVPPCDLLIFYLLFYISTFLVDVLAGGTMLQFYFLTYLLNF